MRSREPALLELLYSVSACGFFPGRFVDDNYCQLTSASMGGEFLVESSLILVAERKMKSAGAKGKISCGR